MKKNVVVVGGGLAGLAAAIYLARGGRTVTLFEKRRALGGRAMTNLRQGFRFNLGAHAVYRDGAASKVYRELGIPVRGGLAKTRSLAIVGGEEMLLPTGVLSLLGTPLLSVRGKSEFVRTMLHVRNAGGSRAGEATLREWLDARFADERARSLVEALARLANYSDHADTASAAVSLDQLRLALRGAIYVDEGWQRLVDSLHSAAISSGVNFVSSSRIVGVHHDGAVRAIELGGLEASADHNDTLSIALPETPPDDVQGARLPAETVLLAVDPNTAADLVGEAGAEWKSARPAVAACLDVALRVLPRPENTFALGLDQPLYYSLHSAFAQLTPKGGALAHLVKYKKDRRATDDGLDSSRPRSSAAANADEQELEALLDRMQPGWRDVLVHRRFLPSMTVSNSVVTPGMKRPSPVTSVRGLYVAGDWVGDEGLLSDAALSSARAAAKAILAS